MNTFNQFVLSCISMAVLVKCYPLQNYGHLLEESAGGYGGSSEAGGYGGGASYGGSSEYSGGEEYGHEHKHEPGMPYKFGYKVYDPHHGTNFGQNEHSDGDTVKGSYQVALPDGRLQLVTYTADWKTGYHADVQYHGKAIDTSSHGSSHSSGSSDSGAELSHSYELPADHAGYTPSSYSGSSEHGDFSGY
uniref:Pro-resilin n=1 Tax=Cacopsylla melanoneura TaxID=428564 RepID=A0A8D8QLI6_9HEMI